MVVLEERTLQYWEKKYGYLSLRSSKWIDFFPASGVFFTLYVGQQRLARRLVDVAQARVYVGVSPWRDFEVGDPITCFKDESSAYHVEKARKQLSP